jgi:hypothetical protein
LPSHRLLLLLRYQMHKSYKIKVRQYTTHWLLWPLWQHKARTEAKQ